MSLLLAAVAVWSVSAWLHGRPSATPLASGESSAPPPRAARLSEGEVDETKTAELQTGWQRFASQNLAAQIAPGVVEQFVQARGRSLSSLLAAWSESREPAWLQEAARRFPDDPAVQLQVLTSNLFPEQRAEWIRRFKESAPENPLANYLAANEQFRGGFRQAAMAELREAMTRTAYSDYLVKYLEDREALSRAAVTDPAEAELRTLAALPASDVQPVFQAAKSLRDIEKEAAASGDWSAAEEAAALGVDIAHALTTRASPTVVFSDLVAAAVEAGAIEELTSDPNAAGALGFDPVARLAELEQERAEVKTLTDLLDPRDAGAYARYAVEFSQRLKAQGEMSALRWLAAQR